MRKASNVNCCCFNKVKMVKREREKKKEGKQSENDIF